MRATRVSMTAALVLLATTGTAVAPQAAAGLEPGVHIDPGSPAAKEYALPLSQARHTGAGSPSSGSSETTFGAGIKPPGSGGAGGSGAAPHGGRSEGRSPSRSSGRGASESRSRDAGGTAATLPPAVQRAVESQDSSGGGGSLPALIGGGVAILVLGGFGGTVLRQSRRPTPSA
jgi:hypothetical protein